MISLFENGTQRNVFCIYIFSGVVYGQLVMFAKGENGIDYSPALLVIMAEFIKTCVSLFIYTREKTFDSLLTNVLKEKKLFLLYSIPAGMYAMYNVLSFYSISLADPTTYFVLLQSRSLATGIIYQILFKKQLSALQWLSLVILTVGTSMKQFSFSSFNFVFNEAIPLILVQIVCACFAGVYNEYLLKARNVDFWVQNIFFYVNSIIINVFIFIIKGDVSSATLANTFKLPVLFLPLNLAVIGITTVMFLKHLNSVLKTIAAACELFFAASLSYLFFGIPIEMGTIISVCIIWMSLYIYAVNPIKQPEKQKDGESMIEEKLDLLKSESNSNSV